MRNAGNKEQVTGHPGTPGSRGFTLIELLVVIGIIGILIAILIPTVGAVRRAGYKASTLSEIGQITSACQNYYQDFRAYPGPLSNSAIETYGTDATPPAYLTQSGVTFGTTQTDTGSSSPYITGGTTGTVVAWTPGNVVGGYFTSSQNLVLGLLGGLEVNPNTGRIDYVNGPPTSNPPTTPIPNTLIGTGPRGLGSSASNPNANKQYTSYMALTFPGSTLLLNGDGTPQTGTAPYQFTTGSGITFYDCPIPVFTDQYPSPMPILYVRARVGAPGVISGPVSYSTPTTLVTDPTYSTPPTANYNFSLLELIPYTWQGNVPPLAPHLTTTAIGLTATSGGITIAPGQHGLQGVYPQVSSASVMYFDPPGSPNPPATPANYGFPGTGSAAYNFPVPTNTVDNGGQYFLNLSVQPTNMTTSDYVNRTGTPRAKDEYILISAGPDRTYGTADDITSFGDVEP
jgi:prepilin-type N-terminal cleavage/methylation domain-containing protein